MLRAAALVVLVLAAWLPRAAAAPSVMTAMASDTDAQGGVPKPWPEPVRHLTIQLPGMSHHFDPPMDKQGNALPGRKFNEKNWGIGVQLEHALGGEWERWITKTSFGVMKDSLDAMGLYAGHAWQKRLVDGDMVGVDLGGGAFLFYRTLRFGGPHLLVPGLLPVLSVTHKPWQLGVNLVAVPRCRVGGGTMPRVIYLQFTKAF